MLRTFVGAVVCLVLVAGAGLSADKAKKGKAVGGQFESYSNGVLTLTIKKKGEEPKKQEFKVSDDTKVTVIKGEEKTESTAKEAFKDAKPGTRVRVQLGEDDKVTAITVGAGKKKNK
jgi:hypothetical protein